MYDAEVCLHEAKVVGAAMEDFCDSWVREDTEKGVF